MVNKVFLLWNKLTKISLLAVLVVILAEIVFLKRRGKSLRSFVTAILSTFLIFLLIISLGRFWLSQRHFLKAQDFAKKNLGEETVQELKRAVYFNPLSDTCHLTLAQASLALANQEAKKENPNQQKVESLIKEAIEEGKRQLCWRPKRWKIGWDWEIFTGF